MQYGQVEAIYLAVSVCRPIGIKPPIGLAREWRVGLGCVLALAIRRGQATRLFRAETLPYPQQ